ncbi:MAG: branched-chain amino acid ABC transporter substrate-binding protein [Deltaproteobacteria bacterium]|nr:branched-chain amino acid ABC transporter substrate-binding protein [Deltaproteobacteria bacterium]MDC0224480.1 ABC transporter substrate-binding protein [Deltaproteobacteria bacterium]
MNTNSILKRLALFLVGALIIPTFAAADIKMGIILGFTGPIESLTPDMGNSAELAFKEVSDSGQLLGGQKVRVVRADSTCIDAAAATAAAERLITSDKVVGIMGADCSGVTTAIANNVAIPNGVTMVSPSATSPALTTIADNGYFFRTAPSDARQGQVLAQITMERGFNDVAVTFINNDYGKGLSDSFINAYKGLGGKVSAVVPHEADKADFSAEVAALNASGASILAVFGYVDQGGNHIIQGSIDSGAFDKFILADGMFGESLLKNIDGDLSGTFGTVPGTDSKGAASFAKMATSAGIKGGGPFTGESYDAAALLMLAMQSGGSTDRAALASNVLAVANTPGEKIMPGELGKALRILANGGAVDYVGATNVELTGVGEAAGSYKEFEVKGKVFSTVRFR